MIFSQRYGGCCDLATFYDAIELPSSSKLDSVAAYLGVTPRTLRSWIDCRTEPPRSAVAALFFESRFGRDAVAKAAANDAAAYFQLARSLEAEAVALRRATDALRAENAALKAAAARHHYIAANDAA